jgi:hypothetical protein
MSQRQDAPPTKLFLSQLGATLSLLKTSSDDLQPTVVSGSTQVVACIMRDIASWLVQNTRRDSAPRSRTDFGWCALTAASGMNRGLRRVTFVVVV